ncbi:energy transducer TonB [Sediminicola sp. 1XM1-17]|uniref:energy transducer TonB n=1 Tax=Sediminicola sp. 1XM1-17 TaxID=3127702 RepID=UPI0030779417
MKKNNPVLCVSILILGLMAFGFVNRSTSESNKVSIPDNLNLASNQSPSQHMDFRYFADYIYDVGTRFGPIKKEDLNKVTSFSDLIDDDDAKKIVTYKFVEVIVIENDKESNTRESGNSGELTSAQLNLLKRSDYSTNLKIRADVMQKNSHTGELENSYWTPHLTIVPEKQAVYVHGKDALMEFLRENSKVSWVNVVEDKLKSARLYFTVTKNGTIENVALDSSSNFPEVDQRMIELIKQTLGKWHPAVNTKGEKVDQELVLSFGLMGC